MRGMLVARILLFFSFYDPKLRKEFPCALVNWFIPVIEDSDPDPSTGMWVLKLEVLGGKLTLEYGSGFLPEDFSYKIDTLDAFKSYFVNHLIDYHAHELIRSS
ncbi:hypothetical protein BYT27DRAFT_7258190 [Phlegmacium glaucopus]|nr:hypothetical protein BYT27DRAFT_7258190 [Phlegmacium glaucopus]